MILVTGATGFLGKRILRRLAEQKDVGPVRCLVRPGTPDSVFDKLLEDLPGFKPELVRASFNDPQALAQAMEGVDVVLHSAASLRGSAAAQVANTVIGSENLFQAAVDAKVSRFVLVSSMAVVGASQVGRGETIDESVPMEAHPEWRDAYSFAKQRQEALAWKFYEEKKLPLVVIRPGVLFGPPQEILTARIGLRLFGVFLYLGAANQIPLLYVDNCADAVIQAGLVKEQNVVGKAYILVDDNLPTGGDLMRRYRKEVGSVPAIPLPFPMLRQLAKANVWYSRITQGHIPSVFTPYKVDAMWRGHIFSNRRAKEELHWSPRVSMKEALDKTFAQIVENKKAASA